MRACLLVVLLAGALAAPAADLMSSVPGYPPSFNTSAYSGYLSTLSPNRSLHYVFLESANGKGNNDPVTLWLNGGPGCSSLLGFLQEIGPYYLEDGIDYKQGDNLTENKYSWHKISNLLFLESPAGVGYSYNLDQTFQYNDAITAHDSLAAVLNFFEKFPELRGRKMFIAGESYAGKYIPDLAQLIDGYNYRAEGPAINLVGLLIGNGVMTFDTLQHSTYEFMIDRSFVDPEIILNYQTSCQFDPHSAGCRFFEIEFDKGTEEVNPYNVYGYCYYNDSFDATPKQQKEQLKGQKPRQRLSQESILMGLKAKFSKPSLTGAISGSPRFNGAPCAFFDGVHDYFNLNEAAFKAKFEGMEWNGPCAENITYHVDPAGSMKAYEYLLGLIPTSRKISLVLYSGNWDAVVPYVDTLKGIRLLNLVESYTYNPWFVNGQHAGFEQLFSGINFITFKGASHQVPQTKRAEAYEMFYNVLSGHGGDKPFEGLVFPKYE